MPEPFGVNRTSIELPSDVSSEIIQKTQGARDRKSVV